MSSSLCQQCGLWNLNSLLLLLFIGSIISIYYLGKNVITTLFTVAPVETAQLLVNTGMEKLILECLHNENQISNKDGLTTYIDESKSTH